MHNFRFSLLELLIGTALAALSCAALVRANDIIVNVTFFALLLSWVIATAIAVNPQAKTRPFWLAFLIMSLVVHYHASSIPLADAWEAIYGPGEDDPFGEDPFGVALVALPEARSSSVPGRVAFVATGRHLLSLWTGLLSGLLARAIHRSTQVVAPMAKT
jgi:hypothetical protein